MWSMVENVENLFPEPCLYSLNFRLVLLLYDGTTSTYLTPA